MSSTSRGLPRDGGSLLQLRPVLYRFDSDDNSDDGDDNTDYGDDDGDDGGDDSDDGDDYGEGWWKPPPGALQV